MDKQREMFEKWYQQSPFAGAHRGFADYKHFAYAAWQAAIAAQQSGQNDLIIALRQACYVLRDLHAKQPDCGLDKLAAACEIAAGVMYAAPEPTK